MTDLTPQDMVFEWAASQDHSRRKVARMFRKWGADSDWSDISHYLRRETKTAQQVMDEINKDWGGPMAGVTSSIDAITFHPTTPSGTIGHFKLVLA
jgi:hypothetical protein